MVVLKKPAEQMDAHCKWEVPLTDGACDLMGWTQPRLGFSAILLRAMIAAGNHWWTITEHQLAVARRKHSMSFLLIKLKSPRSLLQSRGVSGCDGRKD
jgi:hypothetical protein